MIDRGEPVAEAGEVGGNPNPLALAGYVGGSPNLPDRAGQVEGRSGPDGPGRTDWVEVPTCRLERDRLGGGPNLPVRAG